MGLTLDLAGHTPTPTCGGFLEKWAAWARKNSRHPMAMLHVTQDYVPLLDSKSRNMLRKARREGYTYREFVWNDYLDDVFDINTSKPERSGGAMTANYMRRPSPSNNVVECDKHYTAYIGGFKRGRLRAYCVLAVVNELAVVNQILGHADALADGVMNGLVKGLNDYCMGQASSVRYINYLSIESSPEGLARFKRSVGFTSAYVQTTTGEYVEC